MWRMTQWGAVLTSSEEYGLVVVLLLAVLFFSLALAGKASASRSPGVSESELLTVQEFIPLPLYPRHGQDVWQTARLALENRGSRTLEGVAMHLTGPEAAEVVIPLQAVSPGSTVQTVELPGTVAGDLRLTIKDRAGRIYVTRQIEWKPARKWEIHLVQHSHTDLGYTGTQAQVLQVHLDSIRDALQYARATDTWPEEVRFRWNVEVAWSLAEYLARTTDTQSQQQPPGDPLLREMIQTGRIGIPALYLNELYSLNGLEELIRQLYPALLTIAPLLGHAPRSAMLTDVPGVPWGLVPVLYQAGVRYFDLAPNDVRVTQTIVTPSLFWWEGPDGKSKILTMVHVDPPVFTYYEGNHWGLAGDMATAETKLVERLIDLERRGYPYALYHMRVQGTSDSPRYIDNTRPQLLTAMLAKAWNERYAYPRLVVSTDDLFFSRFEQVYGDSLPVFRGDLTDWWVDGAASSAAETALARQTADRLTAAETLASLAWALDLIPDPRGEISDAYHNLILYHEHTWGSDDPRPDNPVEAEIWRVKAGFAHTAARLSEEVLAEATEALARPWRRTSSDGGQEPAQTPAAHAGPGAESPAATQAPGTTATLVVFNSLAYKRTDVVELTLPEQWRKDAGTGTVMVEVHDLTTGRSVPFQFEQREGDPLQLVFVAEDVPPVGYKAYAITFRETEVEPSAKPATITPPAEAENVLENERFVVTLDRQTGTVASLYDRKLQREWVDPTAGRGFNQYVYQLADAERPPRVVRISPGVHGPVRSSLRVELEAENAPRMVQEIFLYHFPTSLQERIEVINTVDKAETRESENAWYAFPVDVPDPVYRYEIPGASVELYEQQLPGSALDYQSVLHWSDISNEEFGITMASPDVPVIYYGKIEGNNRPRPGSLSQDGVRLAPEFFLPTNPGFYPLLMTNRWTVNYRLSQGGRLSFRFGFLPHTGPFDAVAAERFGRSLATPLTAVWLPGKQALQQGLRGLPAASLVTVEPDTATLETVKVAEDGQGLVFRLQEMAGKPAVVRISLPFLTMLDRPIQITAYRADLVERPQAELPVTSPAGSATAEASLGPYEIATIVVRFNEL